MRLRILALTLLFAVVAWAQQSSQTPAPNSTPAPQTKSCCHHKAGATEAKNCCQHDSAAGTEAASCCKDGKCDMKDGKACCEGKEAKACAKHCQKENASCCKDGKCGIEGKGCCGGSNEKTAVGCCGGNKCEHPSKAVAS